MTERPLVAHLLKNIAILLAKTQIENTNSLCTAQSLIQHQHRPEHRGFQLLM